MGATGVSIWRRAIAFVLALLLCAGIGSLAQTQFNLGDLIALGAEVPWSVRAQTTWRDLYGFAPLYAAIVGVGLLPAFVVAGLIARDNDSRRPAWYALAGGVAVWAALESANRLAGIPVLVFATRQAAGLACLVAAGVLAGWFYARRTR
jgi:hypothetical protein